MRKGLDQAKRETAFFALKGMQKQDCSGLSVRSRSGVAAGTVRWAALVAQRVRRLLRSSRSVTTLVQHGRFDLDDMSAVHRVEH